MSSFSLGPHFEAFIRDQVAAGRFSDPSEVVREGLRLVEQREAKLARLRKDIQEAIDLGGSFTEEEIRADLAEQVAALKAEGL